MRGLTSTLVLLVVLAGLVGYIYFVDAERPLSESEPLEEAFDVSPENINDVRLVNADGESVHVQRIDASWQVVEPQRTDADAAAVASITSGLASLEVRRVVDEMPADLAQFGLDPPRFDVTFRASDQPDDVHRLLVGEMTPTGGDLYAKLGDQDRVFLIASYLDTTFDKSAFDLRDKAVLKFDRNSADTLEVEGAESLAFSKDGTSWRISRPISARADYAAVEGLMTRLTSARMQAVVAEDATDLAPYGLSSPSARVTVVSGDARATLLVGGDDPEGQPFAKDEARPTVFTIEQSLPTELQKGVGEFRSKDVFDARSFTTTRVELRRGDETSVFEKTTEEGEDTWRTASGGEVDTAQVEELLSRLTGLRASSFETATHPSLAAPVLTAIMRFDDRTETVTFGRDGDDVYAKREDEPGSARLDAGGLDDVLTALDDVN